MRLLRRLWAWLRRWFVANGDIIGVVEDHQALASPGTFGVTKVVISDTDPGAVGAGALWVRPSQPHYVSIRDDTDAFWFGENDSIGWATFDGEDLLAVVYTDINGVYLKAFTGAEETATVQVIANGITATHSDATGQERSRVLLNDTEASMYKTDAAGFERARAQLTESQAVLVSQVADQSTSTFVQLDASGSATVSADAGGGDMSSVTVSAGGVAVAATGTFTFNGSEVVVVP
jgi:hypothetical protein